MANAAFPGATADREKRRPVLASGSLLSNAGLTWVSPASIGVSGGPYPTGSDSPGSSAPPQPAQPAVGDVPRGSRRPPLKPVQRFVPRSWKSFFQRWRRAPEPRPPLTRALAAQPRSPPHSPVLLPARPKRIIFQDEVVPGSQRAKVTKCISFSEKGGEPATTSCSIPTGHMPKPHVLPDYVVKYPAISSPEEREKYKAVFYDQHAEYRELHGEVHAALQKFQELDAMMGRLPWRARSRQEQSRVSNVCKEYKKKRSDPAFLEKQERCAYLKKKLTHLKAQIQDYDCRVKEGAVYF